MATDSKRCKLSLKRCRTPSRRRESSPRHRSRRNMGKPKSPSDFRIAAESRLGGLNTDKRQDRRRKNSTKTGSEYFNRRIYNYNRYSESKHFADKSKYNDIMSKREKFDEERDNSRQSRSFHYSEKCREDQWEINRRMSRMCRERNHNRQENYDRESHRSDMRKLEIHINQKGRFVYDQPVRHPPIPVTVTHPSRVLLPRVVPHPPLMRMMLPPCVMPTVGRPPTLLAPLPFVRAPIIPLRPRMLPILVRE